MAWKARAITATITFVLLAAGGAAVVGSSQAKEPVFTLPPRHEGDIIQYAPAGGQEPHEPRVVHPARLLKDPHGTWHAVDTAVTSVGSYSAMGMEGQFTVGSFVDLHDYAPVLGSTGGGGSFSGSRDVLGGSEQESIDSWSLVPGQTWHPCGYVHSLQGAQEWSRRIQVAGCRGASTFVYDRSVTWHDVPAMVYASTGVTELADRVELTFAPGIAYPVAIEAFGSEPWRDELVGLSRGAEPVTVPEVPEQDTPLPPVRTTNGGRWGADWGRVDVDYPIEEAVSDARRDLGFTELRDFMEANPDWRIHQAELHLGTTIGWTIGFTSPTESLTLFVTRTPADPMSLDGLRGNEYRKSFSAISRDEPDAPPLKDVASRIPRIDDVHAAWQTYAEQQQADRFRFTHGFCAVSCFDLVAVEVWQSFDVDSPEPNLLGIGDQPVTVEGETFGLTYGAGGALQSIDLITTRYDRHAGLLGQPAGQVEPLTAAPARPDTELSELVWIGVGAGVAAILIYGLMAFKTVPGLALFSRLRAPELLQHPMRQAIHDVVVAEPGIHFNQLQRRTGLANGTLRHHVRYLVEKELLQERAAGGFTCYFAGDKVPAAVMLAAPVLRSAGARTVFESIINNPGATQAEIAGKNALAKGTVGYHLKRLRGAGLVEDRRERHSVRLFATASGRQAARAA